MRITIELEQAAAGAAAIPRITTVPTADSGPAIDAGPPRADEADAGPVSARFAAEDIGGPPASLVAEIEAARRREQGAPR